MISKEALCARDPRMTTANTSPQNLFQTKNSNPQLTLRNGFLSKTSPKNKSPPNPLQSQHDLKNFEIDTNNQSYSYV